MLFRRGSFFTLWILLFGLFYWFHYLEKYYSESATENDGGWSVMIVYFSLWAWVVVYRKAEPELARLSKIFLLLFILMAGLDGPITE